MARCVRFADGCAIRASPAAAAPARATAQQRRSPAAHDPGRVGLGARVRTRGSWRANARVGPIAPGRAPGIAGPRHARRRPVCSANRVTARKRAQHDGPLRPGAAGVLPHGGRRQRRPPRPPAGCRRGARRSALGDRAARLLGRAGGARLAPAIPHGHRARRIPGAGDGAVPVPDHRLDVPRGPVCARPRVPAADAGARAPSGGGRRRRGAPGRGAGRGADLHARRTPDTAREPLDRRRAAPARSWRGSDGAHPRRHRARHRAAVRGLAIVRRAAAADDQRRAGRVVSRLLRCPADDRGSGRRHDQRAAVGHQRGTRHVGAGRITANPAVVPLAAGRRRPRGELGGSPDGFRVCSGAWPDGRDGGARRGSTPGGGLPPPVGSSRKSIASGSPPSRMRRSSPPARR